MTVYRKLTSSLRIAGLTLVLIEGVSASGCKTTSPENGAHVEAVASNDAALWTNPKAIPVCWIQDKGFEDDQRVVKERVTEEYAQAGIGFSGWQPCTESDFKKPVIRVEFRDVVEGEKPGSYTVGCSVVGATYGVLKNCDAKLPGSTMWIVKLRNPQHYSTVQSGLHEFGHAVGLLHEHERDDRTPLIDPNDSTKSCFFNDQPELFHGTAQPNFLTVYDPESIMNYCSQQKGLTASDIDGLIRLYNLPQPNKPINPLTTAQSCTGADSSTVYPNGQVTTYKGRTFTCSNGNWLTPQDPVAPAKTDLPCLGVDQKTLYDHLTVTSYDGGFFTCTNGKWTPGNATIAAPAVGHTGCLGADRVTYYKDGTPTTYKGATWTCQNGDWLSSK